MKQRFFMSVILATVLTLLLLVTTSLFAGGTLAGSSPSSSLSSVGLAQDAGKSKLDAQPEGTWSDLAPLPLISVDEFYPCNPQPCTPQGVNTPARIKRGAAAAYPPNGKIYLFGGRHGLDANEDFPLRWVFEYDPAANTWLQKNALIDGVETRERYVANMAAATLTDADGVRIYLVGGSSIDSVPTGAVRVYDPGTDSITTLSGADSWPASPARVPGGSAVYDNKLYIFGGFSSLGAGSAYAGTWRFDPLAAPGSKWTQLDDLDVARGYIAGAVVDGKLYAAGGDTWDAATRTLTPNSTVEMLDLNQPNPTWVTVASLPTPRGDLRAWAYDSSTNYEISGRVMVAGGPYPVPDGLAYIYDPAVNTWTPAPEMLHPTRNYASTQLDGYLYAIGGYDYSNSQPNGANFSQRYDATTPLGTPTATVTGTPPTATLTSTRTNTATATATVCSANYMYTASTATIVAGVTDAGIHCDDCVGTITLPFPFTYYGETYTTINLSSNGNAQFENADDWYDNDCLYSGIMGDYGIAPYFDDLVLDGTGYGIFTTVTGSAPNRAFYVEWRGTYYSGSGFVNFEMALHEGSNQIEFIYGTVPEGNSSATIGLQKNSSTYVQYACSGTGGPITSNLRLLWSEVVCPTATTTPSSTSTSSPTYTSTTEPTLTPISTTEPSGTITSEPSVTPPVCAIEFTDVEEGSTFYESIRCLACRGIISGYTTDCDTGSPCFKPGNLVTRGQLAKIVANSAGFSEPTGNQQFEDVLPGSTFFDFIWRLADREIVSGYPCGGVGEPCGTGSLPYFRPNNNVTRGQISKIVAEAAGLNQTPTGQQFEDVAEGSTFYVWIWRLVDEGVMNGYPCGGLGEPCGDPSLPYFRPGANATRGQASKIMANTFFPECSPAR